MGAIQRIDRYGQQEDGTWVFRDRQYRADGTPTEENESEWVFAELSRTIHEGDEIPCPELAPENSQVLRELIISAHEFYEDDNIHQVLLAMGWVAASLHSQTIFRLEKCFPLLNMHGEPGSCKTLAGETALSLVGANWPQMAMLARASVSAIYEHGSRTGSLPFIWDDPERNLSNEELAKTWYNMKPRLVRGNQQEPHSPMGITSNHVFGGDQAAAFTRFVRLPFERTRNRSNNQAFQKLQRLQRHASGAFSGLLSIGYPREAVLAVEQQLLPYLPKAHARIGQALAITTFYTLQLLELAGLTERFDVWSWVTKKLCPAEDEADSAGDSLADFIEKVQSLESDGLVGEWNKQQVTARDGSQWIALHHSNIWALVDKTFKPATYNLKALKSLVVKAGGKLNCVQKFDKNRDESLTFARVKITGGDPQPPEKVSRKCWLLPPLLFGNGEPAGNDPPPLLPNAVTSVTESYPPSVTAQCLDFTNTSAIHSSLVTQLPKQTNKSINNLDRVVSASLPNNSTSTTNLSSYPVNSGNSVTESLQSQSQSEIAGVTDFSQPRVSTGGNSGNLPKLVTQIAQNLQQAVTTKNASLLKTLRHHHPSTLLKQAATLLPPDIRQVLKAWICPLEMGNAVEHLQQSVWGVGIVQGFDEELGYLVEFETIVGRFERSELLQLGNSSPTPSASPPAPERSKPLPCQQRLQLSLIDLPSMAQPNNPLETEEGNWA
jgi:hypothetical protein